MAKGVPFSYSFSCPQGANKWALGIYNRSLLVSLTVYIEDDNGGPILVNNYVIVEGLKHQIGQPMTIYDGSGSNAKRFNWDLEKPLSRNLVNILTIEHTNYSGADINSVRVTGVLKR